MDFWRRVARKTRKEKIQNTAIRESMDVKIVILEIIYRKSKNKMK